MPISMPMPCPPLPNRWRNSVGGNVALRGRVVETRLPEAADGIASVLQGGAVLRVPPVLELVGVIALPVRTQLLYQSIDGGDKMVDLRRFCLELVTDRLDGVDVHSAKAGQCDPPSKGDWR